MTLLCPEFSAARLLFLAEDTRVSPVRDKTKLRLVLQIIPVICRLSKVQQKVASGTSSTAEQKLLPVQTAKPAKKPTLQAGLPRKQSEKPKQPSKGTGRDFAPSKAETALFRALGVANDQQLKVGGNSQLWLPKKGRLYIHSSIN